MKVNYDNKRRDLEIKREFLFIGIKSNKMSFMYNCRLYEKVVVGLCTHLPKAGRPRPVTSVEQHPHPHLTRQGALARWHYSCACYDRCLPAAHLQGSQRGEDFAACAAVVCGLHSTSLYRRLRQLLCDSSSGIHSL